MTERRFVEGVRNERSPHVHAMPGAPAECRFGTVVRAAAGERRVCSWCGRAA